MTKWWRKAITKVGDALDDATDAIVDAGTDLVSDGTDLVKNGKCYAIITKIQESSTECYTLAKETSDLCSTTTTRGQDMIDFGSEITKTLHEVSSSSSTMMNAETIETIKDLMDGDRLKNSMALAKDMDDIALECIDKTNQMTTLMEETMDVVPVQIQKIINRAAGSDDAKSELEQERTRTMLSTLDEDINDVTTCISSLQQLNISTALQVGTKAYENLSAKATISRSMFTTMNGFSEEVASYTEAISNGDIGDMFKLASKVKDMWHCLKLAGFMRQLAEGAGKLIRVIIDLFKAMSDRLSTLWSALAFAKDCMVDCLEYVLQAKTLVFDAHDKSKLLIQHSRSITNQLQDMGELNMKSLTAVRGLSEGGEIKKAIEIATNMDDLVIECSEKVVTMVERVSEGFNNLPDIVTADVNVEEEGKDDNDVEPKDIEENVAKLEKSRECIQDADIISGAIASVDGFQGVMDNADTCRNMLSVVETFTGDCNSTIDSFLGVWDLESNMVKIREMCRIVRLGELIKQFAEKIKRLLQAIISLMKATLEKLSIKNLQNIDFGNAVDAVKDKIDDMKDKYMFWKK